MNSILQWIKRFKKKIRRILQHSSQFSWLKSCHKYLFIKNALCAPTDQNSERGKLFSSIQSFWIKRQELCLESCVLKRWYLLVKRLCIATGWLGMQAEAFQKGFYLYTTLYQTVKKQLLQKLYLNSVLKKWFLLKPFVVRHFTSSTEGWQKPENSFLSKHSTKRDGSTKILKGLSCC